MQGAGGTDATGSNAKALADQAKKFEFFSCGQKEPGGFLSLEIIRLDFFLQHR